MCPVILWLLLGSVFKARLKHQKKKCSHQERRTRAKAKVKKFWCRALSVALVVRCRHRPSNKPPMRMHQESTSSEPVRWKWKKRKVGLDSVIPRLESSTLDSFCAAGHDFLCLPQLLDTFCNHCYHVKKLKSALDRVALLCGTYEMHQSVSDHIDPKTLIPDRLTSFRSDFIDYVECDIDVRGVTKVNKVIGCWDYFVQICRHCRKQRLLAVCILPSSINRYPVVLSTGLPSNLWWTFRGEWG
jgi:hypothetical protein